VQAGRQTGRQAGRQAGKVVPSLLPGVADGAAVVGATGVLGATDADGVGTPVGTNATNTHTVSDTPTR
jgi:hypothetical protein